MAVATIGAVLLQLLAVAAATVGDQSGGSITFVDSFVVDDVPWNAWRMPQTGVYFENTHTKATTWSDPRQHEDDSRMAAFVLFISPFLGMAILGGAYVAFLVAKHPHRISGMPAPRDRSSSNGAGGVRGGKDSAGGSGKLRAQGPDTGGAPDIAVRRRTL